MGVTCNRCRLNISKTGGVAILLFLFLPITALPLIIDGMLKRKKWGFVLFACFMGLLGMLIPPTGDFYRYTTTYFDLIGSDWSYLKFRLLLSNDWLLTLMSYGCAKSGIHFDLVRFFYNAVGYYILSLIYLDLYKYNPSLLRCKSWIALGAFMSFSLTFLLFRYGFSMALFLGGSYLVIYRNQNIGWLLCILAFINHFTYLIFIVILFFAKIQIFKFPKWLVISFFFLCYGLDSSIVISLFKFLPIDIVNQYSVYLDGYWAGDFLQDHSWRYRIMIFIGNAVSLALAVIYILMYDTKHLKTENLTNGVLLISVLASPFATIAIRFAMVLLWVNKIQVFSMFKPTIKYYMYLKIVFLLTMLTNITGLWSIRRQLSVSDLSMIVYSPTPILLNHTYSQKWIDQHVFKDGDFK